MTRGRDTTPALPQLHALDLFCCAGGASDGLVRAGFVVHGEVVGRVKTYLDARNCKALAEAFAMLADALTQAEARHAE